MNKGFGGGGMARMRDNPNDKNPKNWGTQKNSIQIPVLKRMFSYMVKFPVLLLFAFFFMITANLLALIGPELSGNAVNLIGASEVYEKEDGIYFFTPTLEEEEGAGNEKLLSSGRAFSSLYHFFSEQAGDTRFGAIYAVALMLAVTYLFSAVFSYLLAVLMVHISQKIIYTMRKQVFDHLTLLPVGYFDTHQTGDIISHISYDIDTVNASITHDLLQVCTSLVTIVGSLVQMLRISPLLILVFCLTVPISIIFTKYKTKKVRPLFRTRSRKLGELNGYAEEMLSGQKTIKAYHREDVIVKRFDARNLDAVNAYYNAEYYGSIIGPSVGFINNISLALITTLGGIFLMLSSAGKVAPGTVFWIDLGMIASFILYSKKFAGPINEFANILSDLQSACAAAERVFHLIDEETEPADKERATVLSNVNGNVEIDHVKFGYLPEKTILHDLSFRARPGSTVAIVGPTGAGKTTIINLLMRFYDVNSGEIRVDGNEIRAVTRESLRSAYTMVLQETWLFCGTIYDNIVYGKGDATREEVVKAAKAAKIHSYIESLPSGYDTVLSDDGVNISKGQKQLITIARAMLAESAMLILDEATSNVDSRTEQQIQEAMHALMKNRTCFVIAHRLSTIQNADLILVVKDGNVIEQGTHDELMGARGFYHSLYHSQFDH